MALSDGISRLHQKHRELVRSGSSVEDKMIDYVEDLIQQIIDENFLGQRLARFNQHLKLLSSRKKRLVQLIQISIQSMKN